LADIASTIMEDEGSHQEKHKTKATGATQVLRSFRVLRILKTISIFPGMFFFFSVRYGGPAG
jgi:hypothetical protein